MTSVNQAAVYFAALVLSALAASCSDSPSPPGSSGSTSTGEVSSSSSGTGVGGAGGGGGTGGVGGAAGMGGSGGAGGSMNAISGHVAMDLVSAGKSMSSPNYSMVYTVGQSTQTQTTTTSPNYLMHGGLIGATRSLP